MISGYDVDISILENRAPHLTNRAGNSESRHWLIAGRDDDPYTRTQQVIDLVSESWRTAISSLGALGTPKVVPRRLAADNIEPIDTRRIDFGTNKARIEDAACWAAERPALSTFNAARRLSKDRDRRP